MFFIFISTNFISTEYGLTELKRISSFNVIAFSLMSNLVSRPDLSPSAFPFQFPLLRPSLWSSFWLPSSAVFLFLLLVCKLLSRSFSLLPSNFNLAQCIIYLDSPKILIPLLGFSCLCLLSVFRANNFIVNSKIFFISY